ncbi:unnamed protein product [Urochloa humidicola]
MRTCILLIVAMAAIAMPIVLCDDDGYIEIPDINNDRVQGLGRWATYQFDSQRHVGIIFNKVLRGREKDSSWFDLIINGSLSPTVYRNYEASVYQLDKTTQPKLLSFYGANPRNVLS